MKQNPCRYCALSIECNGKHSPSFEKKCRECEPWQKHMEYLQSKRKFTEGEQITTIEELLKQEWVITHHKYTKHIKVIENMQLATVLLWIKHGYFSKAIRRESVVMENV